MKAMLLWLFYTAKALPKVLKNLLIHLVSQTHLYSMGIKYGKQVNNT